MWLWKHSQDGINGPTGVANKGTINSKKRLALILDTDFKVDYEKRRRSPNPSVSIARAGALPSTEHYSKEGNTFLNTLPPGTWTLK